MNPAHKSKSAGQVVYTDPKVQSLSNYIKAVRVEEQTEKKLTFDEWWNEIVYTGNRRKDEWHGLSEVNACTIWNAALKKGKL